MCRLLGVVSRVHAPLADHLVDHLKPFAAMSSHHCDGWGTAYWDERDDLVVTKAPEQAMPSPAFWSATEAATTDAALLHLRRASEGMTPTQLNTHPFAAGSVAFAHNGYYTPVEPVDELLRRAGGRPCAGTTDSERYFHLVLASMRTDGPVAALRRTADRIGEVTEMVESLNALMLTSQALYAFSFSNPTSRVMGEATGGTYQMLFRTSGDSVVVASDGWQADLADWEQLPDRSVLEIRRHDLKVTVHRSLD
jgi:predicted glutamine amidotransferase